MPSHADDGFDVILAAATWILGAVSGSDERSTRLHQRWLSSNAATLRRLGLLGVIKTDFLSPQDKVDLLLEQGVLFEWGLKSETYRLLAQEYPRLDAIARKEFASAASEQFASRRVEGSSDYELFNLWVWLADRAPDDEVAASYLAQISAAHPEWAPRDRPDLAISIGEWRVGPETQIDELLELAAEPENVARLLADLPSDSWDRSDALRKLGGVRGVDWLEALSDARTWRKDLWNGLMDGLEPLPDSGAILERLVSALRRYPRVISIRESLSRFVERSLGSGAIESMSDQAFGATEEILRRLWRSARSRPTQGHIENENALEIAINTEGGALAQATLRLLSAEVRRNSPANLPIFYRRQFEWAISTPGRLPEAAAVVCASQLHFFAHVDLRWTQGHLLNRMRFRYRETAVPLWDGFLTWGRLAEPLRQELWPLFMEWWPVVDEMPEQWRSRFVEYAAGLVVLSPTEAWIGEFLLQMVAATSVRIRAEWSTHVGRLLRQSSSEAQELIWESWLSRYWTERLSGVPRELDGVEVGSMVEWPMALRSHFEEAVALFSASTQIAELHSGRIYSDLTEADWLDSHPEAAMRYLLQVLRGEVREHFWHCPETRAVFNGLRPFTPVSLTHEVEERLAQLGC